MGDFSRAVSGWTCGQCGYHNYGFRARCRQSGCNGQGPKGAQSVPGPSPPWRSAPSGAWAFGVSPKVVAPPKRKGKDMSGGGQPQVLDDEQAKVWLAMSGEQFDAAAAVLSQYFRDKLSHMRWRQANGVDSLISIKEARSVQQAIDAKASELQRAKAYMERKKAEVARLAGEFAMAKAKAADVESELQKLLAEAKSMAVRGGQDTAGAEPEVAEAASNVVAVLSGHPGWENQVGAALAGPLKMLLQALVPQPAAAAVPDAAPGAAAGPDAAVQPPVMAGGGQPAAAAVAAAAARLQPQPVVGGSPSISDTDWAAICAMVECSDVAMSESDKKAHLQELHAEALRKQGSPG